MVIIEVVVDCIVKREVVMHVAIKHSTEDGVELFPPLKGLEPTGPGKHQLVVSAILLHLERDDIGVEVQDDEGLGLRCHLPQRFRYMEKLYP